MKQEKKRKSMQQGLAYETEKKTKKYAIAPQYTKHKKNEKVCNRALGVRTRGCWGCLRCASPRGGGRRLARLAGSNVKCSAELNNMYVNFFSLLQHFSVMLLKKKMVKLFKVFKKEKNLHVLVIIEFIILLLVFEVYFIIFLFCFNQFSATQVIFLSDIYKC